MASIVRKVIRISEILGRITQSLGKIDGCMRDIQAANSVGVVDEDLALDLVTALLSLTAALAACAAAAADPEPITKMSLALGAGAALITFLRALKNVVVAGKAGESSRTRKLARKLERYQDGLKDHLDDLKSEIGM